MTYEEALKEIKYQEDMRGKGIDYQVNNLVVAKIVEALEKQIPRKPQSFDSVPRNRCSNCRDAVRVYSHSTKLPFCCWCGQALDWSDTE